MTEKQRQELCERFSQIFAVANPDPNVPFEKFIYDALLKAFIAGAEYAWSNPNWISVEDYEKDELPSLIDKEDQYGCSVSVLFVVNLDGIQYINEGCFDYDIGVWHSMDTCLSYTKEQVTNWIPLPQLPRKEETNEKDNV